MIHGKGSTSEFINDKSEYYIQLGCIRANRLYWSKRIRPKRAERMRARRPERKIIHCKNVQKVDKRLGGKERRYFKER